MKHLKSVFLVLDALGLVAFTILGCQVALTMQQEGLIKHSLLISAVFGVITGVFGGILRDILCNDIPLIFQKELYASVALASAALYLGCLQLNLADEQSMIITLFGGFLFRLLAIKYHWEIPKFIYEDEHSIERNIEQNQD
jgi:uncharacterized membrane protein YeiH